jgi:hypothetical protein
VAVRVQPQALRGLLDGRALARRGHAGLVLVVFLGLGGVAASAVVILVVGPVAALVLGALVALALRRLVLGLLVLCALGLLVLLVVLRALGFLVLLVLVLDVGLVLRRILDVGLVLRRILELGLVLRLVVLVVLELLVLLVLVRLVLGLVEQAGVREAITHPVGHVACHVGKARDLAESARRVQLRDLRARHAGRGDKHSSRRERLHAAMAIAARLVLVRLERRLDGRGENPAHVNRHRDLPG